MKRKMIQITGGLLALFAVSLFLNQTTQGTLWKTAAITFGTALYHFAMRLAVGGIWDRILKNRVNHRRKWFQPRSWEAPLYRLLKVKQWKKYAPTFETELFDLRKHSLEEIIGATCQAELVHETIVPLSFAPLALGRWFGAEGVFLVTSLLAAAVDLCFVVIQRYNRPRLVRGWKGK